MTVSRDTPTRILVVARPTLGRRIEQALRAVGHEVYRTPDPASAQQLVTRLRPQLAVIALDLPWGNAEAAIHQIRTAPRAIPVLVIGDFSWNGFTRLPLEVDATDIQEAVRELIAPYGDD